MNNKLGKSYKLCNKKTIDSLFETGESVKSYPFVVIMKEVEFNDAIPFKMVFSAPKRTFKFANMRNRIKRISKEAVRLNKTKLEAYLKDKNKQLALFLVYTSNEELNHKQLSDNMNKLFNKVITKLENDAK